MKTARAHRKFAIYSTFLDTILEGEEPILDGETRKDTLKRILKDLEETAAELRKEAMPHMQPFMQDASYTPPPSTITTAGYGPTVIDLSAIREKEALEDQIIAATTKDELTSIKDACEKAGLVSQYMNRLKELTSE